MNLVWHIVRKDYRRVAGPLKLWLLLVLWSAIFPLVSNSSEPWVPVNYEGERYISNMLGVIVLCTGFIFAAWLVMEDSLVSTAAFWRTRAISGGRLLAAKALGALLMLSVLPVVVLTPLWLWCGFSLREWAHSAGEWALTQAAFSLAAIAVAGVTATPKQLLVRLLLALVALPLYFTYVLGGFPNQSGMPGNLAESRSILLAGLVVLIPLTMTVHQFLTRRTGRTWVFFVVGLVLLGLAGRWWPWNIAQWHQPPGPDDAGTASGPVFTADRLIEKPLNSLNSRVPVQLDGRVTGLAPGTHVRVNRVQGWWMGGPTPVLGARFTNEAIIPLPDSVVRGVAGLAAPAEGEAAWSAEGMEQNQFIEEVNAAHLRFRGMIRATVLRGAVVGELPLRAGATLRVGSSLTRVHGLQWAEDKLVVELEERDAWVIADAKMYATSYNPAYNRVRPTLDGFVVVNRAQGFDQVPTVQEVGTVKAASILRGRRKLVITAPANHEEWSKNAVIVKVRFTPADNLDRRLSGEPLRLTRSPNP